MQSIYGRLIMDNEQDDFNRPISMDDVVTPITKQPIDQIDATRWHSMDISELWEQKSALQTRMYSLTAGSSHPTIISHIQNGLAEIEAIIIQKTPKHTGTNSGSGML